MKKFISLSRYPGTNGSYYYNSFFKFYKIDAEYTAYGTENLKEDLDKQIKNGVSGISVSMPYKQEVISHLTSIDTTVERYNTCNTLVIDNDKISGYNTDYFGAAHILSKIPEGSTISVLGAGSMGSMIYEMLNKFATLYSIKLGNWEERHSSSDVVINCTNQGTATARSPLDRIPNSVSMIIDLTVNECDLKVQAADRGIAYISGHEFYKFQFLKQFEIYTGVVPDPDIYDIIRGERK
jgi:shikimate 5-dehydrogenase